jgi:outer membrane protein assembly factor BamB
LEARLPRQGVRPVAAGRLLCLPTEQSQLVAVDTTATAPEEAIKWRYQLDPRYQGYSVAIWRDFVLLGNEYTGGFPAPQGELILLSVHSGEEVWRLPVEAASLSVPCVNDGVTYFTVNTGWLYAVDLAARRELWRRKVPSPWSWAPAAPLLTPTGLFILPGRCEQLVAFDSKTGDFAWTFPAGGWFPHTPVWQDGLAYVRCWDRHIYALEADSGREIWRYKASRDYSSDLWVSGAYVYIGVKDYYGGAESGTRAYALYTLDRHTGERIGRYEVQGHIEARPIAIEGAVFFATDDRDREIESQGTLYGLDAPGQQLLWPPYVVEQRFQSDLLLVDDLVIAGTRQGAVYAFRWQAVETTVEAPQVYIEREEWENAAIAYALQDKYTQAAEIYAKKLAQPLRAGRLYLRAGKYRRVIDLLKMATGTTERALAVEAAQAIPDPLQRAQTLRDLGEHLAAGKAFVGAEAWLPAGECFEAGQAWAEARAVYVQANAWDRWKKLTRELELWDELVERLLQGGEYAEAAEIYVGRSQYLKAAQCYDQAGLPAEALTAYSQVNPDLLTEAARQRLAELAEQVGEIDTAIQAYQVLRQWLKAARLAEASARYEQAINFYRQAGQPLKAAELLAGMARYAEAAELFEQNSQPGRAAENLEQQVDWEIERAGGVRFVRSDARIEALLQRAMGLFEEGANLAEEEDKINFYQAQAGLCRLKLMQLRGEPLLSWSVRADEMLLVDEGNTLYYVVENVGWGAAENLTLSIGGNFLHSAETESLGRLKRKQKKEGPITVVPRLPGNVTLKVELRGRSASGELHETVTERITVARRGQRVSGAAATLDIQRTVDRSARPGALWDEGSDSSPAEPGVVAVSPAELKQQRIESLRRQLARHYANLNKLQEQAAIFGAGQAPLELQNGIEIEESAIAEIEDKLSELQE